jgi:hypothetical protein
VWGEGVDGDSDRNMRRQDRGPHVYHWIYNHRIYHCHHYRVDYNRVYYNRVYYNRVYYRGRRGGWRGVYYRHGELPSEDEFIAMQ